MPNKKHTAFCLSLYCKISLHILKFNIMQTINIKAYTEDESQIEAVKAFMKALKIKFEISKDNPYKPEFVEKILQGDIDYKAGKGKKITMEELNSLWK